MNRIIGWLILAAAIAAPAQNNNLVTLTPTKITASGVTTTPIQILSSYAAGTLTVASVNLTTATFAVYGSNDNGATYNALAIQTCAVPGTYATTETTTGTGCYQVNLAGLNAIEYVTSGTFTGTSITLTMTASPNAQISRGGGGSGSSGFPITLGSTSIASGSTTTSISGLTLVSPIISGAAGLQLGAAADLWLCRLGVSNFTLSTTSGCTASATATLSNAYISGNITVATGTGYAYANGSSPFTYSTTIPFSAISGTVSTTNALTGTTTGGAAAGSTYNGSAAVTFDYHTLGAAGLAAANAFTNNNTITAASTSGTPLTLNPFSSSQTAPLLNFGALGTATSGTNFNSGLFGTTSSYWTGSAAGNNTWQWQDVLGTGTNPTSTLTLTQTGTSGVAALSLPNQQLKISTTGSSPNNPMISAFAPSLGTGNAVAMAFGKTSGTSQLNIEWWNNTTSYARIDTQNSSFPLWLLGSQVWLAAPTYVGNSNFGGSASQPSGCTGLSVGTTNQTCLSLNSQTAGVACSTSGTATFSQPESGTAYKVVTVHFAACLGTVSYTFPVAYTNAPSQELTSSISSSLITTVSTTAVTFTGATSTGDTNLIGF